MPYSQPQHRPHLGERQTEDRITRLPLGRWTPQWGNTAVFNTTTYPQ